MGKKNDSGGSKKPENKKTKTNEAATKKVPKEESRKVMRVHLKPPPPRDGPINQWAHCSPRICKSCLQNTHKLDRDADPPEFLKWIKNSKRLDGTIVCVGDECYRCSDVRTLIYRSHHKKIGS